MSWRKKLEKFVRGLKHEERMALLEVAAEMEVVALAKRLAKERNRP
jgi:hypothetical protein